MSQLKKLFLVFIAFTLFQWMVKCNSPEKSNSESLTTTKNCHCNDLIYDDLYNHFYIDDRTLPYSGSCYEKYKSGKIKLTKEFLNGKLHGDMIRYRDDSSKISLVEFEDNFIEGRALFYDIKGNDSAVQYFKKGKLVSKGHQ